MSKYSYPKEYLIYYPGTDVPRNKKGIKNASILQVYDKALLLKAYYVFNKLLTKTTKFDQKYFINLHKTAFQRMYYFAGEFRNQDVSKGNTVFCKAKFIHQHIDELFIKLKDENYLKNYKNSSAEDFAEKIAFYMGEIIAIHPFWEFNGRITRMFFDLIAVYNGYNYIDYSAYKYSDDENSFIQASILCVQQGDDTMLKEIVLAGLLKK